MLPCNKWNEINVQAKLPSYVGSCEKKLSRLFQIFHSRVTWQILKLWVDVGFKCDLP